MFEKASRLKLRFYYHGLSTVEDLWDISLTGLDSIFKELNATAKTTQEESLLETKTEEDEELALSIAIVRHVAEVRLAEKKAKKNEAERKEKKQRLMSILAEKQDEELRGKSAEEIAKMIEEL